MTRRDARAEPLPLVTLTSAGPAVVLTLDPPDAGSLLLSRPVTPLVPVGEAGGPTEQITPTPLQLEAIGDGSWITTDSLAPAGAQLAVELVAMDGQTFLPFVPASDGIDFALVDGSLAGNLVAVAAFASADDGARKPNTCALSGLAPGQYGQVTRSSQHSDRVWGCTWLNLRTLLWSGLPSIHGAKGTGVHLPPFDGGEAMHKGGVSSAANAAVRRNSRVDAFADALKRRRVHVLQQRYGISTMLASSVVP